MKEDVNEVVDGIDMNDMGVNKKKPVKKIYLNKCSGIRRVRRPRYR